LGGKPWKPRPTEETLPVFRLRDQPMQPERGVQRDMFWMHFVGSVQLFLPLDADAWAGVSEEDLEVRVSKDELAVRCKSKDLGSALDSMNGKLRKEVNRTRCSFAIERDVRDPCGKRRVLVVELAKQQPGKAWPGDKLFHESIFNRKSFGWTANQTLVKQDAEVDEWTTLRPGRRSDVEDPFTVSRGWLCTELEQGQTDDLLNWRIVLDQKKLDEAMEKVPYYHIFGADCSARYFKFFIRGDESSPVLLGRLGGQVSPDMTFFELTTLTREVEGHRIVGTMETVPVLNVTLVKAPDWRGDWEEMLGVEQESLNGPQGTLEEFEQEQLRLQREPSPDREDWTPDDWADEQKENADAAFKDGSFRDAIVYYTRALRHTPLNEKLLSNRSAGYFKTGQFQLALDDAEKAQQIQPRWPKIYFRKGQALRALRRFEDAVAAFRDGQSLERGNVEWEKEIQRTRDAEVALEERRKAKAVAK